MSFLEKIKAVDDLKTTTVFIDAWGFDVELKEPGVGALLSAQKRFADKQTGLIDPEKVAYEMLTLCVYEDGEPVFKNVKECKAALGDKGAKAIMQLATAAKELVGIGVEAEETEKN